MKFKKNEQVYTIESDNKGGCIIKMHTVAELAIVYKEGTDITETGDPITVISEVPSISIVGNENEFHSEHKFYKEDEIPNLLKNYLGRAKLW